ncbi:MAG: hypothetical protein D6720_06805 [Gammaproteobacteria bacterium]|nr:MAG: hypothetical protein D6720_06805 [Gammaproteobacteria bacterium]
MKPTLDGAFVWLLFCPALWIPGGGIAATGSDEAGADEEIAIEEGIAIDGEENETEIQIDGDMQESLEPEGLTIEDGGEAPVGEEVADRDEQEQRSLRIGLDEAWLEYGQQLRTDSAADRTFYGKLAASIQWYPDANWEVRLAARIDGYDEDAGTGWSELKADYGDSFVRYRNAHLRLTIGADTVIWGRMDEIPLSDRVSVADLTRFILDNVEDRRRSAPMVRLETDLGEGRLDIVWLADFRGAELPDQQSIWYPIDKRRGRIIGIDPADIPPAAVQAANIVEDEPDGDGGFGVRFTASPDFGDVGLTVAHTRQSVPYYRSLGASFKTEYPRSWTYGVDAAVDAMGATWRGELVFDSDVPATRSDLSYTTTESVAWGMGVELHPGDGDTRVNLQLMGSNRLDAPSILERTDIYNINGEVEVPFDRERWRASLDFYLGLDAKDVYINPEISFLGWEPHELYLALHYFDGDAETLGGFHKEHGSLNLGWRAKF